MQGKSDRPPAPCGGGGRSLASLCHGSSSFDDELDPFRPVDVEDRKQRQDKSIATVFIDDGDLSDDDALNLDFEKPCAVPLLGGAAGCPPPSSEVGMIVEDEGACQPTASRTSVLSWSQSSPSRYVHPRGESAGIPPTVPLKRDQDVADLVASLPPPKKRSIPKHWGIATKTTDLVTSADRANELPVGDAGSQSCVPSHLARDLPWDATTSLVQVQKKQLRGQQRKLAGAGSDPTTDDIQETVATRTRDASKTSAIALSNEQRHVKTLVCERGRSVFFTGPAGTGKSVLMRAIIQELEKKWSSDPDRLAVTASTGLAACNIGGMTLHSFSGIGLGKEDAQTLVKKIRRNPKAKNRWLRTKVLIIDEISMVDGDLFDKLSQVGRTIRNNGRPWGGIQLVITGDFFQLPPVPDGAEKRAIKFAFEAATWNTSIDHTIGLTEVFRQKDPRFANMLNELRLGRISDQTVDKFKELSRPLHFHDGLEVTELFPTRTEVDNSNDKRLKALQSKPYRYEAIDTGDSQQREKLLQNMMAPKTLELRKGAQVMLIKNMDESLVNGSLGTVVRFMSEASFQALNQRDGYGSDWDDEDVAEHDTEGSDAKRKRLMAFSRQLEASGGQADREYPLVRFHAVDGSPRTLLCVPEEWKSESPTGELLASRKQVPLILAWALSIHKAQGQTLERVKVDLGKVFEKGQAYVALSRATSLGGLQVMRFEKHKVMAHPRVVQFYNRLYSAERAVNAGSTQQPATGIGHGKNGS